ncbi:MAG: hypothetical protein EGQ10_04460 [Clostridiales bacterium]|nr:hypothetical protein [Clostridiales bacterium]
MARSKAVGASLLYMLIVLPIAVKVNKIIYSLFNFLSYVSKRFGQKCHSILLIFVKKHTNAVFSRLFVQIYCQQQATCIPKLRQFFPEEAHGLPLVSPSTLSRQTA